jgi:hypothetical protein
MKQNETKFNEENVKQKCSCKRKKWNELKTRKTLKTGLLL